MTPFILYVLNRTQRKNEIKGHSEINGLSLAGAIYFNGVKWQLPWHQKAPILFTQHQ